MLNGAAMNPELPLVIAVSYNKKFHNFHTSIADLVLSNGF